MKVLRIQNWMTAHALAEALPGFWFRGHTDAQWRLETTFERVTSNRRISPHMFRSRETLTVREFRRRAHHYEPDVPPSDEHLEWLALMQHYGAPTRLLDFTQSFYVAAFFALEKAMAACAVWAVNRNKLDTNVRAALSLDYHPRATRGDRINELHIAVCNSALETGDPSVPLVIPVWPERMNRRLAMQQGTFLFPLSLQISFEDNLLRSFDLSTRESLEREPEDLPEREDLSWLYVDEDILKILLPKRVHYDAMRSLRSMNVTAETLFAGLDGFARSLHGHFNLPFPTWKEDAKELTDEQNLSDEG